MLGERTWSISPILSVNPANLRDATHILVPYTTAQQKRQVRQTHFARRKPSTVCIGLCVVEFANSTRSHILVRLGFFAHVRIQRRAILYYLIPGIGFTARWLVQYLSVAMLGL